MQKRSTLICAGTVATALCAAAQPANAFSIANTSATWDNVLTRSGDTVGSSGIAASDVNLVKFLEADGTSQVRWGEAFYGGHYEDVTEYITQDVTEYVTQDVVKEVLVDVTEYVDEEVVTQERVKKTRQVPKTNKKGEIQYKKNGDAKTKKENYFVMEDVVTTVRKPVTRQVKQQVTEQVEVPVTKQVTTPVTTQVWVPPTYENQSGLGFAGVSNLDLTLGEAFNIGQLSHFNQTIYTNDFIGESAEIALTLDFGIPEIGAKTFNFGFNIDETTNYKGQNNNGASCAYQTTAGLGCSDKITWDFSVDESNSFTYDGEDYSLELVGFAEDLAGRNLATNFISQEEGNSSSNLFARLIKLPTSTPETPQDIPEPTALLGLAGLGLYGARSRKKRSEAQLA